MTVGRFQFWAAHDLTTASSSADPNEPNHPQPQVVSPGDHSVFSSERNGNLIDIITIGSRHRNSTVQQDTFARHRAVRHFWKFTEEHDHEPDCDTHLDDPFAVSTFCHDNTTYPRFRTVALHFVAPETLAKQSNPAGWLCAQKRPITALARIVKEYYSGSDGGAGRTGIKPGQLPSYLILLDDDSWLRLDIALQYLGQSFPPAVPAVIAGCLIRSQYDLHYTWPWGGFGTIFTKSALVQLGIPLWCSAAKAESGLMRKTKQEVDFVSHACQQLKQNRIGESEFFRDGMTLVELMDSYSRQQSYTKHAQWEVGFCMHSDMALGYFLNMYHVGGVHKGPDLTEGTAQYERLAAYNGTSVERTKRQFGKIYKSSGYCTHRSKKGCTMESHLCHYMSDDHMLELFRKIYKVAPHEYR